MPSLVLWCFLAGSALAVTLPCFPVSSQRCAELIPPLGFSLNPALMAQHFLAVRAYWLVQIGSRALSWKRSNGLVVHNSAMVEDPKYGRGYTFLMLVATGQRWFASLVHCSVFCQWLTQYWYRYRGMRCMYKSKSQLWEWIVRSSSLYLGSSWNNMLSANSRARSAIIRTMWVQLVWMLWCLEEDSEYLAAHLDCHWELGSLVMSSCSCFSSSEQEYDSLCLSWIAGMPNKSLIAFHARSQKAKDCDFLWYSSKSSNCLS